MTDTSNNSVLDENTTEEQTIDRLDNSETVIQKDVMESLISTIMSSVSGESDTPVSTLEVLRQSLAGLKESDPEMAQALEEVLDDPEVIQMLASMERISDGTATQDDIDAFSDQLPQYDGATESEVSFAPEQVIDAASGVDSNFITARASRLYEHLNKFDKTAKYIDLLKTKASDGASSTQYKIYQALDYMSNGRFDADANFNAPSGKIATGLKTYGLDALSAGSSLASVGLGAYGIYSGVNQVQDGDKTGGGLAIAASSVGLAKVSYQLTKTISTKLASKLGPGAAQDLAQFLGNTGVDAGTALSKRASAFAFGVGSAFAVAAGAISITQNALAAKEAFEADQDAVGAIYVTMAVLDGISMGLDIASLAMDFVPGIGTAISIVLDLINLGIAGINIGLSFAVGLFIDKDQLQDDAWEAYLASDGFQNYMSELADSFKNAGYDSLEVLVDSLNSGVPDYGTGNILESWQKRALTERAENMPDARDLRLAILDMSVSGHDLDGRDNDDYIAGGQGNDRIRGFGGDDILRGEQGHDIIYGGDGDDVIIPGLGNDEVDAGAGNDTYYVEVGADKSGIGGEGESDTAHMVSGLERFSHDPYFGTEINLSTGTASYTAEAEQMAGVGQNVIDMMGQSYWDHSYNHLTDRKLRRPDGSIGLSEYFFEVNGGNYTHREQKWNHTNGGKDDLDNAGYVLIGHKYDSWTEYRGAENGGYLNTGVEQVAYYNVETDVLLFTRITNYNGHHDPDTFAYHFIGDATEVMYNHLINSTPQSANELDWGRSFVYMLAARKGFLNYETDISGTENVIGTRFSDRIIGNAEDNYLDGRRNTEGSAGDRLEGGRGDDIIVVHNMNDIASGGSGNNTLVSKIARAGQDATHRIYTTELNDVAIDNVDTTLEGQSTSFASFNRLVTGDSNDTVYGNERANRINTGAGINTIHAGAGNDILEAGKDSTNTFNGESGDDLFDLRAENASTAVKAGDGDDTILGGAGAGVIDGGDGFDTYIYQGEGRLMLDLEKSDNQISQDLQYDADNTNNVLSTVTNVERFIGGGAWDVMKGNDDKNILNGGGVIDNLYGRGGDDVFVVDTINTQDDQTYLGKHQGQYHGDDGVDTVNYESLDLSSRSDIGNPHLIINLGKKEGTDGATTLNTAEHGDQVFHTLHDIENVIGTSTSDTIYGNDADNVLDGLTGDQDVIFGYDGNDTLSARGGLLNGGSGHDTYLIRRDSRNLILEDKDLAEADRIIFDGVSLEEVSLKLGKGGFDGVSDVLSFQIEDEGEMVTLASWSLPEGAVVNDSWQPLFKAVAAGLYHISFIDPVREGEESRDSVTLETPKEITAFLYDRLVNATTWDILEDNIQDQRGRDIQLDRNSFSNLGTSGSDIIRAGTEAPDESESYALYGGSGSDILVNAVSDGTRNKFYLTDDDTLDGRQGQGEIRLYSNGDMDTTNIMLGADSGSYSLSQTPEYQTAESRGLNLILDGDADLIKTIDGNQLVLSNGSTLDLFDRDELVFDSIRFAQSGFNAGEVVTVQNRDDLNQWLQAVIKHQKMLDGELTLTNVAMEEVTLNLTQSWNGEDLLQFQTQQNGETITLENMLLPAGSLSDDSWETLFTAITHRLSKLQFANDTVINSQDAMTAFLYQRLIVATETAPLFTVNLSETVTDSRGRDFQLLKDQGILKGTLGDDILRAGAEDRDGAAWHDDWGYWVEGGEGQDLLVNSKGLSERTVFTLTADDTLDGRQGSGVLMLDGEQLDDTRVVIGQSSGDYTIYSNSQGSDDLDLIIDGNLDLLKGIEGNQLILSNDSKVDLFDKEGTLVFDSLRFTQGAFNNGDAVAIHNRSDLDKLLEQVAVFKADRDSSDFATTESTYQINQPLNNLYASSLA